METSNGKLQIVVRSKKVLVRDERFDVPVMTQDGRVSFINRGTLKVYDYVFDEAQARALRESRELAKRSGLALEVTDLSRQSLLGRMLRPLLGRNGLLGAAPNLVVELSSSSMPAEAHYKGESISSAW